MFLYFFLVGMLCCCESLTSVEIFDVFDEFNMDAAMDEKTSESFFTAGANSTTGQNSVVVSTYNYSATVATDNSTNSSCTDNNTKSNEKSNSKENPKGNETKTFSTSTPTTTTAVKHWIYSYNTFQRINNDSLDRYNKFENITEMYGPENETIAFADSIFPLALEVPHGTSGIHVNNGSGTLPAFNIPLPNTSCPEEETPANIGAYEVPTQRDVVLHLRNHLTAMYHGFHFKAMHFLKDIQQVTQASWSRKMYCHGPTELMYYRRCVRWVADMSVLTTKSLVTALETARRNITAFMQGKICNISSLNVDPIHLIRILAAEKVSLEFALPDFLRQLDACARYCPRSRLMPSQAYLERTHLTDRDFVVRHYLTQQNYNQQLSQQFKI